MSQITFSAPPNHRTSESCATCAQWESGNDDCQKFPCSIYWTGGRRELYDTGWHGMVCDAWEPRQDDGGAA